MYPAPFDLHRPSDLAQVHALLRMLGADAKLLAGGHSLLPAMKLRLATPAHLIDLSGVQRMHGIRRDGAHLVIGALSTHWQVQSSPIVADALPFLAEVAGGIADAQVRNRGTIGGSLAHADPAADYPAALLASGAELVVAGPHGERSVPIDAWFVDMMTTALDAEEVLVEVRVPAAAPGLAAAYLKHKHPASRFAMPGVAVALTFDDERRCRTARIGVTGAAPFAVRAAAAEAALQGSVCDASALADAAAVADRGLDVGAGFQVDAEGMCQLVRTTTHRALELACAATAARN